MPSAQIAGGRRKDRTQAREQIIQALRDYAELYGADFTAAAFSPATARWRARGDEIRDRYYAGNPKTGRPWPSLNGIKTHFDESFNAARVAAGFTPNKPGGPKRPAFKHSPELGVREVKVTDAQTRALADRVSELTRENQSLRNRVAERPVLKGRVARAPVEPRPRTATPAVRTVTQTKTKTVKVVDKRGLARAEKRAGAAEAALVEVRTLLRASEAAQRQAVGQSSRLAGEADVAAHALTEARSEVRAAVADARVAERRAAALERGMTAIEAELGELRGEAELGQVDRDTLRASDLRARDAETRAAAAEQREREIAAAVTGKPRQFTAAEIAALRHHGPTGEAVLGVALREFSKARKTRDKLATRRALIDIAKAAVTWADSV